MYPFSLLIWDFSNKGLLCFLSDPTSWLLFEWLMLTLNNACCCTLNVVYLLLVVLLWLVHIFVQTWDKFDPSIFEENCLSVPSIFHRCYQVLHLHHPGINKRVFHMLSFYTWECNLQWSWLHKMGSCISFLMSFFLFIVLVALLCN